LGGGVHGGRGSTRRRRRNSGRSVCLIFVPKNKYERKGSFLWFKGWAFYFFAQQGPKNPIFYCTLNIQVMNDFLASSLLPLFRRIE
jgi:hypothetical protein